MGSDAPASSSAEEHRVAAVHGDEEKLLSENSMPDYKIIKVPFPTVKG